MNFSYVYSSEKEFMMNLNMTEEEWMMNLNTTEEDSNNNCTDILQAKETILYQDSRRSRHYFFLKFLFIVGIIKVTRKLIKLDIIW